MRVAVTGATGHVGANVVRALLDAQIAVRALCRPNASRAALDGLPVETVTADILEPPSLNGVFRDCDAVIHLAAVISVAGDPDSLVRRTNVDGTRNVAAACLDARVGKVVHISSIHAYDLSAAGSRLDEDGPRPGPNAFAYDRSKVDGEAAVRAAISMGLDAVILNPTGVLGPHDYHDSLAGQMLRDLFASKLPALVDGAFDWVDARDLAAAIIAAIDHGRTGENYLIAGHGASIFELAALCARASGKSAPRVVLPIWTAVLGLPFLQAYARLSGQRPLYTYESLMILKHGDTMIAADKAKTELGYAPRPLEETVRDVYAWWHGRD